MNRYMDNMLILDSPVDNAPVQGVAFILSAEIKPGTKQSFASGILLAGTPMSFKAWNNTPAFGVVSSKNISGKACYITGLFNYYRGNWSVLAQKIQPLDTPLSMEDFLISDYEFPFLKSVFGQTLNRRLSPKGKELMRYVLDREKETVEAFTVEFAAKTHHDNSKNGLFAHTTKMIMLLDAVYSIYCDQFGLDAGLLTDSQIQDLLYLGCVIHDIGKIQEMHYGEYQANSFVTHRVFGLEFAFKYKDIIIEKYNEHWYYNLLSITSQHHDEYGEPCQNLYAYIIHMVDTLDANLTEITQIQRRGMIQTDGVRGDYIMLNDRRLFL